MGIQASSAIDAYATRLGLVTSGLTAAQLGGRAARAVTILSSMLGISLGCLLGRCALCRSYQNQDQSSMGLA